MKITRKTQEIADNHFRMQAKEIVCFRNVFINNQASHFLLIFFNQLRLTYLRMSTLAELKKMKLLRRVKSNQFQQKFKIFLDALILELLCWRRRTLHSIKPRWLHNMDRLKLANYDERKTVSNYLAKFQTYLKDEANTLNKEQEGFQNPKHFSENNEKIHKVGPDKIDSWLAYHRMQGGDKYEHLNLTEKVKVLEYIKYDNWQPCCLNCISYLRFYSVFQFPLYEKQNSVVYAIKQLKMQDKGFSPLERDTLEKMVCAIVNERRGFIFIGITNFIDVDEQVRYRVSGITGSNIEAYFTKEFFKLIQSYIQPRSILFPEVKDSSLLAKYFNISFIPVLQNLDQIYDGELNELTYEQVFKKLFVIRIKIDLGEIDPRFLFYVQTPSLNHNKQKFNEFYQAKNNKIRRIQFRQVAKQILSKYNSNKNKGQRQKRRLSRGLYGHDLNINCVGSIPIVHASTSKEDNFFSISNKKYGTVPICIYDHESLIMVPPNFGNEFARLREQLTKKKINFKFNKIYEGLPKNSAREVYYMTHQKKTEDILKIHENLKISKDVHIAQIRTQFMLINPMHRDRSFQLLAIHFKAEFHGSISYGYKSATDQHFYHFDNTTHATFAFVLMEYNNIRCNFVNYSKLSEVLLEHY